MKLRLFLFLCLACTLLAGRAMAQGCSDTPLTFPTFSSHTDRQVASGTCIANDDTDGSTSTQGGRLRWNNNNSRLLELFDHDDNGQRLWCDGKSNSSTTCIPGNILCLQADGNMVIYTGSGISCTGDHGTPVWASNTAHLGFNDSQEALRVEEDVSFKGLTRSGDRAVIRNGTGVLFCSLGYVD